MDMISKVYSHIEFEQIYEAMNQTHERINNIMSVRGKLGTDEKMKQTKSGKSR